MTDSDPLAAFDEHVLTAVTEETALDGTQLRDALRRHQEHARSLPGVDDLVYEWRRFLPYDPLVHRETRAYYLVFQPSVWSEFGEQLAFSDATLAAVRAVHDRQLRRVFATLDVDESVLEGGAAMVLTR